MSNLLSRGNIAGYISFYLDEKKAGVFNIYLETTSYSPCLMSFLQLYLVLQVQKASVTLFSLLLT